MKTGTKMKKREVHGNAQHPLYQVWAAIIQRCTNPAHRSYPIYGGRGIKICETWRNSFGTFLADMGERPPGSSIDRINGAGNYEPGNCRWASSKDQRLNTSTARLITAFGDTKCLKDWESDARCLCSRDTLRRRLNSGWPADVAISTRAQTTAEMMAALNTGSRL